MPVRTERAKDDTTWYEFACRYVDMKWKLASAKYRKDIARALTAATPAMLTDARGRPDDPSIRRALTRWAFNTKQRGEPPADVAEVLSWVAHNSAPLSALADAAVARQVLHQATGRLDGTIAAASTARRHCTIPANAMDYAVELNLLDSNPIRALKWTAPKVSGQVDRRWGGVEPGPGAGAARRGSRPAAERPSAGGLFRAYVLCRSPARGSG